MTVIKIKQVYTTVEEAMTLHYVEDKEKIYFNLQGTEELLEKKL